MFLEYRSSQGRKLRNAEESKEIQRSVVHQQWMELEDDVLLIHPYVVRVWVEF